MNLGGHAAEAKGGERWQCGKEGSEQLKRRRWIPNGAVVQRVTSLGALQSKSGCRKLHAAGRGKVQRESQVIFLLRFGHERKGR